MRTTATGTDRACSLHDTHSVSSWLGPGEAPKPGLLFGGRAAGTSPTRPSLRCAALLPPERSSFPRLTRRLAFRPAAFAICWSSMYFSESSCWSEVSAIAAPAYQRPRFEPRAQLTRRPLSPPHRSNSPAAPGYWLDEAKGSGLGHGNYQWRCGRRGVLLFSNTVRAALPSPADWATE